MSAGVLGPRCRAASALLQEQVLQEVIDKNTLRVWIKARTVSPREAQGALRSFCRAAML